MKNLVALSFILLLAFPAFVPWMPHGALQALHVQQESHHGVSDDHAHIHDHNHNGHTQQSVHHPVHFDVVTYFSDYLHVDLQSPEQSVLKAPAPDTHDIDYPLAAVINPIQRYELASVQSRAPPDTRRLRPDKTPLYLSTLRLRI
ncbi:MAG TPA: hypothetical protein EYG18_07870 [Micavibrio sp.]|nr:hypothetical protein [Alphaproteobacteria bacterium]HIL29171.1 hypothetical protein [Micavibrio sp.]